jgi:hypothetical protein
MATWQDIFFAEGFSDINYNFVAGEFGVFEGRGWDVKPQKQIDDQSLDIAYRRT